MRRSDREITDEEEIRSVIDKCDVCRLAFNDEKTGYPYVLPLNFGWKTEEDGSILFCFHGAAEGYKYEVMKRDARASFEMDCGHTLVSDAQKGYCTMEYRCVMGQGRVEPVTDRAEKTKYLSLLTDRYHEHHFEFNPAAIDRTAVFVLHVERMTAKQRTIKKQSY